MVFCLPPKGRPTNWLHHASSTLCFSIWEDFFWLSIATPDSTVELSNAPKVESKVYSQMEKRLKFGCMKRFGKVYNSPAVLVEKQHSSWSHPSPPNLSRTLKRRVALGQRSTAQRDIAVSRQFWVLQEALACGQTSNCDTWTVAFGISKTFILYYSISCNL